MAAFDLDNYQNQLRKDSLVQLQTILQDFLTKHGQEHHHLVPCYLSVLKQMSAKPEDFLKGAPRVMADLKITQPAFANPFLAVMFRCAKKMPKLVSFKLIATLEERELLDLKACLIKAATEIEKVGVDATLMSQLNQKLLEMTFSRKQLLGPHYGTFQQLPMGTCYHMLARLCQAQTWYAADVRSMLELLNKMQEVSQNYFKERKQEKEHMKERMINLVKDPRFRAILGLDDKPAPPAAAAPAPEQEDQQEDQQPQDIKKEDKTCC